MNVDREQALKFMERQVLTQLERQDSIIDEVKAKLRTEETNRKLLRLDLERVRAEIQRGDVVSV